MYIYEQCRETRRGFIRSRSNNDFNGIINYNSINMKQLRQGDVLLESVDSIPAGAKKRSLKSYNDRLLVRGESANHAHYATGEVDVLEKDEDLYLDVFSDAQLKHLLISSGVWTKEHKPIELDLGKYRVIRQREYNPYEKAMQQVQD